MTLSKSTLTALAAMPDRFAEAFSLVPADRYNWTPASWEGIPGERFSALGQLCHVRDIERLGYHVRIARLLTEDAPSLISLDSYELATQQNYVTADAEDAMSAFRTSREHTLRLLQGLTPEELARHGTFGEYGPVTLRSLVHYLGSHDHQHLACLEWLLGQIHATGGA